MFLIRNIEEKDLPDFFKLAAILNTYNLPKNRKRLAKIISLSQASFQNRLKDLNDGRYVFVAEDLDSGKIIGTSEIIAKRGQRGKPFIYCDVGMDRMKSKTLKKEIVHRYIRLNWTENGTTEVGGLVVDPRYRGKGLGVGKALSFARFMYLKVHREKFQKRILSELLAYLDPKGENPLWNFLGQHFTGLSYHEADHLSASNKEFILSLFPREKIYTCLLPRRVQEILEIPGPKSIPAKILLERIGFKYLRQVDPFDGGPLYGARVGDISIYQKTKAYRYRGVGGESKKEGLVLSEKEGEVRVRKGFLNFSGGGIEMDSESARALRAERGEKVWVYLG